MAVGVKCIHGTKQGKEIRVDEKPQLGLSDVRRGYA
jgi:hypothetical protein